METTDRCDRRSHLSPQKLRWLPTHGRTLLTAHLSALLVAFTDLQRQWVQVHEEKKKTKTKLGIMLHLYCSVKMASASLPGDFSLCSSC